MYRKKSSIGITGGIGSGKSYVCHILEEYGIPVFYTDDEAKKEMLENKDIHKALARLTGKDVILPDGGLNKPLLAHYIAQGDSYAQEVNAIVHPAVRERMRKWLKAQQQPIVAVECALLFEAGYQADLDYVIAVTAPEDIKIERVMQRDGHTRQHILKMMALQLPDEEKAAKADAVIVNDNTHPLRPQIEAILTCLTPIPSKPLP